MELSELITRRHAQHVLRALLVTGIAALVVVGTLGTVAFLRLSSKQMARKPRTDAPRLTCDLNCPPHKQCALHPDGSFVCACPTCPTVFNPVCGNDGRTYDSECHVTRQRCLQSPDGLVVSHYGVCSCRQYRCGSNGTCVERDGSVECRPCRQCPEESVDTVCGSDGASYASRCHLERHACLTQHALHVSYVGKCREQTDDCAQVKCPPHAHCLLVGGKATCECPKACVTEDRPVCGSDGVTYPNECALRVTACRQEKDIAIQRNTSCDLCQRVICKFGATCSDGRCLCPAHCTEEDVREPICANDGNTYWSGCELKRSACLRELELSALFYGICDESDDTKARITSLTSTNEPNCPQECHRLGSSGCDQHGRCLCKNGVTGTTCDRCEPGFWGLHRHRGRKESSESGDDGCLECRCNQWGAVRQDCDQSTGRCVCKHGIRGLKCDRCPEGAHLHPQGCLHVSATMAYRPVRAPRGRTGRTQASKRADGS